MRRSIRLGGFDYAGPAAYLVTIATHLRQMLFGNVVNGEMTLSPAGLIVRTEWLRSAEIRTELILDSSVVMPNHFHAIVIFDPHRGSLAGNAKRGVGAQRLLRPYPIVTLRPMPQLPSSRGIAPTLS